MLHFSDLKPASLRDIARPGSKERARSPHARPAAEDANAHKIPSEGAPAGTPKSGYTVLVADDHDISRSMLVRSLALEGHAVVAAENGQQALELLRVQPFDLLLLDIMMPVLNGFQVLEHCRSDPQLRNLPVVVVSGNSDLESVVRCVEMGAADYLLKPFDHVLFKARVDACLETKRLRDQEQAYLRQLKLEQEKSERLLLNILPAPIADRLKQEQGIIAESFDDVTVLFADLVDFTALSTQITPTELVGMLNEIFSLFDKLAAQHGLEKIKTIGDAYMVVGGLPGSRPDHAEAVATMALDMRRAIARFNAAHGQLFTIRIGISSGPAVAGVIGTSKFAYDLWGDTVNMASRMESHGLPGQVQVSASTYQRLRKKYHFTERGPVFVKGKGETTTYLLGAAKKARRPRRPIAQAPTLNARR